MRRKRPRASVVLLVLSIALGAVTTVALRTHLARLEARAAAGATSPVVVTARDLSRGAAIAPEDVRMEEIPSGAIPPDALLGPEEAVGMTLAADVAAGEPLTTLRLARAGPVAALVPHGLRAVPLTAAVPAAMLAPGDRVDVLKVVAGRPFAETVVAGAEVLAVRAASPSEGAAGMSTLVLLATPEGAGRIAAARASGEIAVVVAPAVEVAAE